MTRATKTVPAAAPTESADPYAAASIVTDVKFKPAAKPVPASVTQLVGGLNPGEHRFINISKFSPDIARAFIKDVRQAARNADVKIGIKQGDVNGEPHIRISVPKPRAAK